jgi:hypothetical protein
MTWGTWTSGGYGGTTIVQQPANIYDWLANGTVVKDMVSIAQSHPPAGGVAYDGYEFGYIAVDWCGFEAAANNVYCYPSEPSAYHFQYDVAPVIRAT